MPRRREEGGGGEAEKWSPERRFMTGVEKGKTHQEGSVMIRIFFLFIYFFKICGLKINLKKIRQRDWRAKINRWSWRVCVFSPAVSDLPLVPADVSPSWALIIYWSSLPFLLIMRKSNGPNVAPVVGFYETMIRKLHICIWNDSAFYKLMRVHCPIVKQTEVCWFN